MADQQTPDTANARKVTLVGPAGQWLGDPFDDPVIAARINIIAPYHTKFDYDASTPPNLIYYGLSAMGSATSAAVWQIRKFTYSGSNVIDESWANGNNYFNNIWDNRASLSYS